jgi:hypothetical protein
VLPADENRDFTSDEDDSSEDDDPLQIKRPGPGQGAAQVTAGERTLLFLDWMCAHKVDAYMHVHKYIYT